MEILPRLSRRSAGALLALAAVGAGIITVINKPQSSSANLDSFAQCLTNKGVTMYGADWCPHCEQEKNAFGESWRYINYVECGANPPECLAAGIKSFPTWIFPDGRRLEGEQGLINLSTVSQCALPPKK